MTKSRSSGGGQLLHGDLVQQLPPGGGLAGLGLVGGEAGDEGLQLLDLLLGLLVLVPDQLLDQLAGLVPEVIVAHVHLDLAVVDVHDVGADVVEEVAVMAHHQHCALIVHEEVLQPDHACQVQVVGGLVQQQHVGLAEEGLGQQHLHLEPGIDLPHQALMQLHRDPQALEDASRVALRLVAAKLGEFLLQLRGPDAVLVGEILLLIDGVLLPAAVIEPLVAHDDGVQHPAVVIEALVLLQNRHAALGLQHHGAAGGLQLAG